MLIQFSVANYRSIKEKVTLSLVSTTLSELKNQNVINLKNEKFDLLKTSVLYGANSSGKSNIFEAMKLMRDIILSSSKETRKDESIDVESFLLDNKSFRNPTEFEIVFKIDETKYRYGFSASRKKIHKEWLYHTNRRESPLFNRNNQKFNIFSKFEEGKGIEKRTRENALFLSAVANWNGTISGKISKWFHRFNIISGLNDGQYRDYTIEKLKDKSSRELVEAFLKEADLDIEKISTETIPIPDRILAELNPEQREKLLKEPISIVKTYHRKNDVKTNKDDYVEFVLDHHESEGTKKFLYLSMPIIDTLVNGKVLVVDELDSRLHPLLVQFIVKQFHTNTNKNNAQLIFATHDTNLLDNNIFRRDQIWFCEKNAYSATKLYSLADYKIGNKKIRKDESYSKNYLIGKYGGVPYIGHIEELSNE